ncbi:hypothetical protein K1719_006308 [Acacia pycnantha]|nr:hypothetical protein K1719_006308 [Acacia pycnantha]
MEEPTISDPLIWNEEEVEKMLIGKVLSAKTYSRSAIERILQKAWNLQSGFNVIEITGNTFMFWFSDEVEYNRILRGRPWSINGLLLNLMERSRFKQCEEFDFSHCPTWIQIHNVPMEAMYLENAIRIGNNVGEVVLAEEPRHNGRFLRTFLRVRVVLDLRKPLASGFWLNNPDGGKSWISIRSPEELIVIVKDSWEEVAYYRRKKEEAIPRKTKEHVQKMAWDSKKEEEELFCIKLLSSSERKVEPVSKFQEVGGSSSNPVGEPVVAPIWQHESN